MDVDRKPEDVEQVTQRKRPESPRKSQAKEKIKNGVLLWDKKEATALLDGIVIAGLEKKLEAEEKLKGKQKVSSMKDVISGELRVCDKMFCVTCNVQFTEREEQVEHFKSDWHRFNLKKRLRGDDTVSEEKFEEITNAGDLSSISGSDSSTEEDESSSAMTAEDEDDGIDHVEGIGKRHPRVFLRNDQGQLLSVFRAVVHTKQNRPETADDLVSMVTDLPSQMTWAILMLAGGHFAGAIFDGNTVVEHKTFHRYVIRAKRGTVQSSHDNKGSGAKSGGASLRRYNEAALAQEIQTLLTNWSPHIKRCDRIFIRAPTYNKSVFFGGKTPTLGKSDRRIRLVPFQTRRPTFKELHRVHELLASIEVYGVESTIEDHIAVSPKKTPAVPAAPPVQIAPAAPVCVATDWVTSANNEVETDSDSDDEDLMVETLSIDTNEPKPCEATKKPRRKKKPPKTKQPPAIENTLDTEQWMDPDTVVLRNGLYTACKTKNVEQLLTLLADLKEKSQRTENIEPASSCDSESSPLNEPRRSDTTISQPGYAVATVLNQPFGDHGLTLLHVAAQEKCKRGVSALMEAGADPAIKDGQGRLPYIMATCKDTRNEFRRFMAKFPDLYDYAKAQVPGPISEDQEKEKKAKEAERKKLLRKVKKDRLKDQKAEEAQVKTEQEERQRFLTLTDREKRALAADRRMVAQASNTGQSSPVLSRCFQCASDITGKVPFEYAEFKFCTPKCLKAHRLATCSKKS